MAISAEVVVIGGGVNGASIAYHLAKRGVRNVVLLEKGHIASGPTGLSSGIVRQHYSIETLARMALDSVRVFQNFGEQIGGDAGFVQTGGAFLCPEALHPAVEAAVEMHRRVGIRETIVSASELEKREPGISLAGIAFGTWEPDAGYADPALTANSFAEAAQREGVQIRKRTPVTGLKVEAGRITRVITATEEIATRTVVNAAGPWGGRIAEMAGASVPIYATRHPVVIMQRPPGWRTPTPFWADMAEGWYYKPERNSAIMVGSIQNFAADEKADADAYSKVPEYHEIERYSDAALRRFPALSEGMVQGGWAGVYDMTPDGQPVLDRVAEVEGFYCACGFSGHGFKLSPAVGKAISELVLDGRSRSYDLSPFRYARFREGQLTRGAYEYSIIG